MSLFAITNDSFFINPNNRKYLELKKQVKKTNKQFIQLINIFYCNTRLALFIKTMTT